MLLRDAPLAIKSKIGAFISPGSIRAPAFITTDTLYGGRLEWSHRSVEGIPGHRERKDLRIVRDWRVLPESCGPYPYPSYNDAATVAVARRTNGGRGMERRLWYGDTSSPEVWTR